MCHRSEIQRTLIFIIAILLIIGTSDGPAECKAQKAIALYMVSVREHCSLSPEMEKELKEVIKSVGGSINQSGLFLSTTSTATTVTKESGVNRRSVAFIPRGQVGIDLLETLDSGTSFW